MNAVIYSGTEAHGHDLHALADLVRRSLRSTYYVIIADETHKERDHTITYAFVSDSIKGTTDKNVTSSTKEGAATPNPVRDASAN